MKPSVPTSKQKPKKYLVIDFNTQDTTTCDDLFAVKKVILARLEEQGQTADWATETFEVFEIKERIIFTAKEEIQVEFGLG